MGVKGKFFLIISKPTGLVLNIKGDPRDAGTPVIVWQRHGKYNQVWYEDTATGTIRSKLNQLCLDIKGQGSDRLIVNQYQPGNTNQQWLYNKHRKTIDNRSDNNKVLDVVGAATHQGAEICQWNYHGMDNQQWTIEPLPTKYFFIKSALNGKVLGIEGGNGTRGAKIIMNKQKAVDAADNQLWFEDHYGNIRSKLNEKLVLDVSSGLFHTGEYDESNKRVFWHIQGNKIVNKYNVAEVLEVKGANTADSAELCAWNYHGGSNQHWHFEEAEVDHLWSFEDLHQFYGFFEAGILDDEDVKNIHSEYNSAEKEPSKAMEAVAKVRDFEDAVLPLLEEGIRSVRRLASAVLAVDPNNKIAEYENIRQAIEGARKTLNSAEKAALVKVEEVNDYYSNLIVEKGKLQKQKERNILELANLKLQLTNLKEMWQTCKNQLKAARNDVISKKRVLDELHEMMKGNNLKLAIGATLLPIPIFGTTSGAILIGVSQADLNKVRGAIETAERVSREADANFNELSRKMSYCDSEMKQKRKEMHDASSQSEKLTRDIAGVAQMSKAIANVHDDFLHATNMLAQLAEGAKVNEIQTRRFVVLQPLVFVLADTAQKMAQISHNEKYRLLQVNDVKPLVTYLNENLPKLKAICEE